MVISSRRTSPKYGRLYLVHQLDAGLDQRALLAGPARGELLDHGDGSHSILVCQWDRRTVVRDCWTSTGPPGLYRRADQLPIWTKYPTWHGTHGAA